MLKYGGRQQSIRLNYKTKKPGDVTETAPAIVSQFFFYFNLM